MCVRSLSLTKNKYVNLKKKKRKNLNPLYLGTVSYGYFKLFILQEESIFPPPPKREKGLIIILWGRKKVLVID